MTSRRMPNWLRRPDWCRNDVARREVPVRAGGAAVSTTPFAPFGGRSPPVNHVFVYGTLRRGGSNDITRLQPAPRFVGTAQVCGKLYDLGAYPGIVLEGGGRVRGEVYAITPALERQLDEIECVYPQQSDEYFKRAISVDVSRPDGRVLDVMCICYEYNPRYLDGAALIASGDWMRRHDSAIRN